MKHLILKHKNLINLVILINIHLKCMHFIIILKQLYHQVHQSTLYTQFKFLNKG